MNEIAKCMVLTASIAVAASALAAPGGKKPPSAPSPTPPYASDNTGFPIGPFLYKGEQPGFFFQTDYGTFWIELVTSTSFSGFRIRTIPTYYLGAACQDGDEILLTGGDIDVNRSEEFEDYIAAPAASVLPQLEPQFLLVGLRSTYGSKTAYSAYSGGQCYEVANGTPINGYDVVARVQFNADSDLVYPVKISY